MEILCEQDMGDSTSVIKMEPSMGVEFLSGPLCLVAKAFLW